MGITNGDLKVNGHTLDLLSLEVLNTGTLTMTNPNDTVFAGDFASFGGGSTAGRLTNGVLILLGRFRADPDRQPDGLRPLGESRHRLRRRRSAERQLRQSWRDSLPLPERA